MPEANAFRLVADLLPEPMVLVSRGGIVRAANAAFRECVGAEVATPGRDLRDVVEDDPAAVADYLRRCASTRHLVFGAMTLRCRHGGLLTRSEGALFQPRTADEDALVLVRFIRHESATTGFSTLNDRITELGREVARRKAVENDLRDQREWLQVTLASIADAVLATDTNGHIVFLNPVARTLTGWRQSDAIGQSASLVLRTIDEETRERVQLFPLASWSDTPTVARGGLLLLAQDETERPIELSAAPIREASGRVIGAVAVFRDVTERRRTEKEKDAAHQAADAANRAKDEFLATLSHELRTPLNAILGWTRLLQSGRLDEEAMRQAIDTVERNALAQARLVEDLLDVARIVRGELRLEAEVVDFFDVVEAAIDTLRTSADAKHITVRVMGEGLVCLVTGDRYRLQQIVWNLVSNAIKFTPKGGHVEVLAQRQGSDVELQVRDTGIGIPPEFLANVFDPFQQVDATTTRRHGGLGLGLSIVRHLVELHGGTVRADSEGQGRGTTFAVRLPLLVAHHSPREGAQATALSGATPAGSPAVLGREPILHGIRVLIVEDDRDGRQFLARALSVSGATVHAASTVREALAAVPEFQPQVILSDIGLPEEDGFALIHALRAQGDARGGNIPAIALTGYARPEDRQRVLDAGFQRHLAKPVDAVELVEVVATLARRPEPITSADPTQHA